MTGVSGRKRWGGMEEEKEEEGSLFVSGIWDHPVGDFKQTVGNMSLCLTFRDGAL